MNEHRQRYFETMTEALRNKNVGDIIFFTAAKLFYLSAKKWNEENNHDCYKNLNLAIIVNKELGI